MLQFSNGKPNKTEAEGMQEMEAQNYAGQPCQLGCSNDYLTLPNQADALPRKVSCRRLTLARAFNAWSRRRRLTCSGSWVW